MRFKEFAQLDEIKKGAKDSNGFSSCWTGYHASGTKKGKNGGQVRNCVPNKSVAEAMSQRNKDQGAIGHGLPWKRYDDLDQLAQDISDKILTITNIVKLNNMAHDSTIYNALERYFKKYGYPDNVFNRVASIVFKKLDDEGRRMTTDPRIQEQGVAEVYTPSPAKPFRNPPGFNKQGTGVGNKLAQLNRKEWEEKKKKERGVAEGGGGQQAAIAIANRESGKYTKDGKRLKEGSLADAAKHVKKGALHKQEGIPADKKIGANKLKSLKAHGTPLEKKRANFALNIQGIKENTSQIYRKQ